MKILPPMLIMGPTVHLPNFFATSWLDVLVALVISVSGGGGIVAYLRNRKEGPKILVDAAQGAVVVQSGVIDSLRVELSRLQKQANEQQAEIAELRNHLAEVNSLRARVRELEQDNEVLKAENTKLRSEIKNLRKTVRDYGIKAHQFEGLENI